MGDSLKLLKSVSIIASILIILITSFLITSHAPINVTMSTTATTSTITKSPYISDMGNLSSTNIASYIVFKGDDGRIYAKSGDTGQIVASDTDLGKVLQAINDREPDYKGLVVYMKPGQYEMYTGVRIARAGFALIGAGTWDASTSWEIANCQQCYFGTLILLRKDSLTYFDVGFQDVNRPMRLYMAGFGAVASSSGISWTQHQNSVFLYMRNWMRHTTLERVFIRNVGRGIKHEVTQTGFSGMQDVYIHKVVVESPYYTGLELRGGGYNLRVVDFYTGWNTDAGSSVFYVYGFVDVWVDRLWILGLNLPYNQTAMGATIHNCKKVFVRDMIIRGVTSNWALRILSSSNVLADGAFINLDGGDVPNLIRVEDSSNVMLRNIYGVYTQNPIYISNSQVFMENVRLVNKNTNAEYRSENRGVATIPAGSTRVTVFHYLLGTPSKVLITPLGQPAGKIWVENITSTSFDIVTDTAPSRDLQVLWYADLHT
jgi:hypothetical protein